MIDTPSRRVILGVGVFAAGGTKHYSELLKPFGLDAKDPKFWDGGLSVISGMIDELEEMG